MKGGQVYYTFEQHRVKKHRSEKCSVLVHFWHWTSSVLVKISSLLHTCSVATWEWFRIREWFFVLSLCSPQLLFTVLYLSYVDTSCLFYTIPLQTRYLNGAFIYHCLVRNTVKDQTDHLKTWRGCVCSKK